jgi:tetratricopeptide (TPR) repeat protein
VNKSLVVAEFGVGVAKEGGHRYQLLETLRQYGRDRLLASGQFEAVHHRHASHYLARAESVAPELSGPRQAALLEELARNESDLRAALEWLSEQGHVQDALRLASVLGRFWEVRCNLTEGRRSLAAVLALPGAETPSLARAKVLDAAGMLAMLQDDKPVARAQLRESVALYRQLNDVGGLSWALIQFGFWCVEVGRLKAARRVMQQALGLCRQLGDRRGTARCLSTLGLAAMVAARYDEARSLAEESLPLSREVGDRWGTAWALTNLAGALLKLAELGQVDVDATDSAIEEAEAIWTELGERRHLAFIRLSQGTAAVLRKDFECARMRLDQSLAMFNEVQDPRGKEHILFAWSRLFVADGKHEPAARLLGAIDAYERGMGEGTPNERDSLRRGLDAARRGLGTEALDTAFREGSAMSVDAAIAYVQAQGGPRVGNS